MIRFDYFLQNSRLQTPIPIPGIQFNRKSGNWRAKKIKNRGNFYFPYKTGRTFEFFLLTPSSFFIFGDVSHSTYRLILISSLVGIQLIIPTNYAINNKLLNLIVYRCILTLYGPIVMMTSRKAI